MLETLRAFGLDQLAAEGEDRDADDRLLAWAVQLTAWIGATLLTEHEPEADAVLRREMANLRAAWRLARRRGDMDAATAVVAALYDAMAYRDLVEIRGWAEELAGDPAVAAHPRAAAVLGTAGEAAYHRGDHAKADRLGHAALEHATDDEAMWFCVVPLVVSALARGAYAEVVERCLAASARGVRSGEMLGIAALACAYDGNLDRARELQARGSADVPTPTMRAWSDYVAGEIVNFAGHPAEAQRRYRRAIDLARGSGATFVVGVASVGLLTVLTDAGRVTDALRGYRDVVDYFARTGNWPHLWPALRNLADLLRRIGDPDPAAVLDAAADHAPDAPAHNGVRPSVSSTAAPSRTDVLTVARNAIERNVRRVESRPASRSR